MTKFVVGFSGWRYLIVALYWYTKEILCSYDNPWGNAETERVIRTIKEELLWLNKFSSFEEAEARIGVWIEEDYNRLYVHSALGYLSPEEFAQQWAQTQEATSQGAQI
jgi:transposase InsO family protein